MTMPDDTFPTPELLARLAAGDRAAFAVVVETWQRPLAGFLGRMGLPPARVEELVQDSFVRVWLNIGQYRPAQARFSTWLYTIARRLALNELDRAAHRHEQAAPAGADPDAPGLDAACPEPGPPAQLARRRRQALQQSADAAALQASVRTAELPPSRWPRLRALALAAGGLLSLAQVLAFLLGVWSGTQAG